ncbi:MAG: metal ABC transporter permease [Bacteroidota bacterium]
MNLFFWTVAISFLVALNCTLIGSFLIVRSQAMLADAMSHTALLGIVLSCLVTGSMDLFFMLGGAIMAAVVSALLVNFLHGQLGIVNDVAINFVFSAFFALAVILIVLYAEGVDLDLECVLYGQLPMMPFDVWLYKGYNMGPKAFYLLIGLSVLNISYVGVCYPMLVMSSFDPMFADTLGVNNRLWSYGLMIMAAITIVLTYRIVGSVLVLAFFVIPPLTTYLLVSRLSKLILYACVLNMYIALGGYKLAILLNGSISGAMVMVASLFFAISFGTYCYKKLH